MTFNYFESVNQRNKAQQDAQQQPKSEPFVSKHTYKIQEKSATVVVSFIYREKPDLEAGKIVYVLKQIIQKNPLQQPPRVYGHKFYLSFSERPQQNDLKEIEQIMRKTFPGTKVFVKFDEVTAREKATVYVGKMLGVSKEMMEDFLETKQIKFKEVRVAFDKETQRPKNFGYIEFHDEETAKDSLDILRGQKLGLSDGLKAEMMVDK